MAAAVIASLKMRLAKSCERRLLMLASKPPADRRHLFSAGIQFWYLRRPCAGDFRYSAIAAFLLSIVVAKLRNCTICSAAACRLPLMTIWVTLLVCSTRDGYLAPSLVSSLNATCRVTASTAALESPAAMAFTRACAPCRRIRCIGLISIWPEAARARVSSSA